MTFRFPRLVRVLWTDFRTKKRKQFCPARLARDEDEAWAIAEAADFLMVPQRAKRIVYQTAVIVDRRATGKDALAVDTQWQSFMTEGKGLER